MFTGADIRQLGMSLLPASAGPPGWPDDPKSVLWINQGLREAQRIGAFYRPWIDVVVAPNQQTTVMLAGRDDKDMVKLIKAWTSGAKQTVLTLDGVRELRIAEAVGSLSHLASVDQETEGVCFALNLEPSVDRPGEVWLEQYPEFTAQTTVSLLMEMAPPAIVKLADPILGAPSDVMEAYFAYRAGMVESAELGENWLKIFEKRCQLAHVKDRESKSEDQGIELGGFLVQQASIL